MAEVKDCIFCKIIKGEIPCTKIYEDKDVFVMLDISPACPQGGHTLVMPKKHYELITDIPDKELCELTKIIKKMAEALLKYGQGLNIIQNNKKVAGQFVPHVHFHLIPRFEKDGVLIEKWATHKYPDGEMIRVADRIKKLLKD
ncbi:MAG: HIT family protein [Candidatus Nanoarchaeia archaeon]|nr:HIT family protein [Candidatus Nanoarchaeia archaeon]MDD5587928.1 HIT family protein [Candidatus Nanoarchaeia archaeon]